MDKTQAVAKVQSFFALLLTDFDAAVPFLSGDFVWDNFLPAHIPFGGRYHGVAGLRTYLGQLAQSWQIGELVFLDYIFDPESRIVAVTGVEKNGKALSTGRACDMSFVWEFRFTPEGTIRYVREYNDTVVIGSCFDQTDRQ